MKSKPTATTSSTHNTATNNNNTNNIHSDVFEPIYFGQRTNLNLNPPLLSSRTDIIEPGKSRIKRRANSGQQSRFVFTHKNPDFLKQHYRTFSSISLNRGDADTYFKTSLRNYDDLKFEALNKTATKSKTRLVTPQSKTTVKPSTLSDSEDTALVTSPLAFSPTTTSKTGTRSELDVFYSPLSHNPDLNQSKSSILLSSDPSDDEEFSLDNCEIMPQGEDDVPSLMEEADTETADEADDIPEQESPQSPRFDSEEEEDFLEQAEDGPLSQPVDTLDEVSKLIEVATSELEKAVEENEKTLEKLGSTDDATVVAAPAASGSFFNVDPNIDPAVLVQLEEAEKEARHAATIISELKMQVKQLLQKDKMTEAESRELEMKNKQLKEQMMIFEEKTRQIQALLETSDLFEKLGKQGQALVTKSAEEEYLPKMIVCGTQQNIPKIILCENFNKRPRSKTSSPRVATSTPLRRPSSASAPLTTPCYSRPPSCGDSTSPQSILKEKKQVCYGPPMVLSSPCGNKKCPLAVEEPTIYCGAAGPDNRDYNETTQQLEKQLRDMEMDVKTIHDELSSACQTTIPVNRDTGITPHRKFSCLQTTPQSAPPIPPSGPTQTTSNRCFKHSSSCFTAPPPTECVHDPCTRICTAQQQLRKIQEQYNRLQDDFKSKLTEVAILRTENDKLKTQAKDGEENRKRLEEKIAELEKEVKILRNEKCKFIGSKEQLVEQEQQLAVAKQRFREAQDELEELRFCIEEKQNQMDDYRNKYLEAQQQVEEQKRQIAMMELDIEKLTDQVNLEIKNVKNSFQEKLQDLAPLPEMLKITQIKLQDAQEMHLIAERNNEALSHDIQMYKEKLEAITSQIDTVRSDQQLGENEKAMMCASLKDSEERCAQLQTDNDKLREELMRLEALADENECKSNAKTHEIAQLCAQLDNVREEAARQVARNKDRCETVRRSMQNQISDLERQLAQSRAHVRNAQKDRDEIRQKMQLQIGNLQGNFEDAQLRIKSLQGHVSFLRENFGDGGAGAASMDCSMEPCFCGHD